MPTESAFLLAGLLFVAAALGYVFAKFGDSDTGDEPADRLNSDYLRGLNYLLNEEADRAVEVFTRMAELDDDTVETHLALGSLFRKRGELERAIRVHQNLMARPGLSRQHTDQAQMALAEDYLGAGLLDRAENLYARLRDSPEFRWQALERLIRVFEMTQEWEQAIATHAELERLNVRAAESGPVAHYYCELAERARSARDYTKAREMLKKAEASRRGTVRSELIAADIARELDDHREAVRRYGHVVRGAPDLLAEVLPRLAESCRALDDDQQLSDFLRDAIERDETALAAVAMSTVLDPEQRNPVALDALRSYLLREPTVAGLLDARELEAGQGRDPGALERIRGALRAIVAAGSRYRCRECGYATLSLQWQCPSCRAWETVRPEARIRLTAAS